MGPHHTGVSAGGVICGPASITRRPREFSAACQNVIRCRRRDRPLRGRKRIPQAPAGVGHVQVATGGGAGWAGVGGAAARRRRARTRARERDTRPSLYRFVAACAMMSACAVRLACFRSAGRGASVRTVFTSPSALAWWSRRTAATRPRRSAIAADAHRAPVARAARGYARGSATSAGVVSGLTLTQRADIRTAMRNDATLRYCTRPR